MRKDIQDLSMISKEQTLTGTTLWNWLKLLWNNKFKISFRYLHKFFVVSFMVLFSTPLIWLERLRFNRKIKKTKIEKDPIFILGHWRSGTTYLHMLLTRDEQFAFCSNLQTFMPHVFLGSKRLYSKIISSSMPEYRRQDNFKLGVDQPSEEDFAISNMCQYSFYHGLAFPKRRQHYSRYIAMEDVPEKEIDVWKEKYLFFIKKLTFAADGKQLVLKNPPNTARVKLLLELFPNAKFVHIYRNPYKVFPSTMKMYNSLVPPFFLQVPDIESAEQLVFDIYEQMHRKYFNEKELIPEGNLIEIKYEQFLQDPFDAVKSIYDKLSLDHFEQAAPEIKAYIASQKSYKTNKHQLPKRLKRKIASRWKQAFKVFGYGMQ